MINAKKQRTHTKVQITVHCRGVLIRLRSTFEPNQFINAAVFINNRHDIVVDRIEIFNNTHYFLPTSQFRVKVDMKSECDLHSTVPHTAVYNFFIPFLVSFPSFLFFPYFFELSNTRATASVVPCLLSCCFSLVWLGLCPQLVTSYFYYNPRG